MPKREWPVKRQTANGKQQTAMTNQPTSRETTSRVAARKAFPFLLFASRGLIDPCCSSFAV
jgi:hypothetical protein